MGKVMVVDDEADVLKVMEDILRIAGYKVCCYKGAEHEGAISDGVPSLFAGLRSLDLR